MHLPSALAHRLVWVSSLQLTDGQQDPKNSWKHFPLSLEAGWAVSNIQQRFGLLLMGQWLVYTSCFQPLAAAVGVFGRARRADLRSRPVKDMKRSLGHDIAIQESVIAPCSAQQTYFTSLHCLCWPSFCQILVRTGKCVWGLVPFNKRCWHGCVYMKCWAHTEVDYTHSL